MLLVKKNTIPRKCSSKNRWNMSSEQQIPLFLELPFQHCKKALLKTFKKKGFTAQPWPKEFKLKLEKLKLKSLVS